jgi:hypothetical protein
MRGYSASLVSPLHGLFSALRHGTLAVGAHNQRTPIKMPPSRGRDAFQSVPATSPHAGDFRLQGRGDAFLQVLEPSATVATVSSFSLGESGPFLKKVRTKGYLPPSAWYAHMECRGPSLQPTTSSALACNSMVFLNRKRILGALSFCHSVAQP